MTKIKVLIGYLFLFYISGLLLLVITLSHTSDIFNLPQKTPSIEAIPDFGAYTNTQEKKNAFFNFIRPFASTHNKKVIKQRKKLTQLNNELKKGKTPSKKDLMYINELSSLYRVDANQTSQTLIEQLLYKVNIIPESLVLAQAANESAWGTSRFAKQGNNFFGQWCFTKGCGVVPSRRAEGATHEVAVFSSTQHAVSAYIDNLNSHPAYKQLRNIRNQLVEKETKITGFALAEGLINYSERKEEYIAEIQAMIRTNKLE